MSQRALAVRAPIRVTMWRSSMSSVTMSSVTGSAASDASRARSASALWRPLYRTVRPEAIRAVPRPGSGGPSKASSILMGISMTPRRRPMSVAAGVVGGVATEGVQEIRAVHEHPFRALERIGARDLAR